MNKEPDDPYSALSRQKRDRKSMEKKMPENWEFGGDAELLKKRRRRVKAPDRVKSPPPVTTLEGKELIEPKVKPVNLDKLEEGPVNAKWKSWPLDHWLENLSNPEGKDFSDLKKDLLLEVDKMISEDHKDSSHAVKRPRKRIKRTSDEIPKEVFNNFFDDDQNNEPFGLEDPTDYELIQDLLLDYREKEGILEEDNSVKFDEKNVIHALDDLEVCSMSYCSDFLREFNKQAGERPCRHGDTCIFILMANKFPDNFEKTQSDEGFVCREFLLPSELETWKKENKLPPIQKLCLGCNRYFTTKWHFICLKQKIESSELIQDHYNETNKDGEYDTSACIYPNVDLDQPPRVIRPIIEFKPEFYIYSKIVLLGCTSGRNIKLRCVKEIDFRDLWNAETKPTILGLPRFDPIRPETEIRRGLETLSIPSNAPINLLRPIFENSKNWRIYKNTFCTLSETVEIIRKDPILIKYLYTDIQKEFDFSNSAYSIQIEVYNEIIEATRDMKRFDYYIISAILLRIHLTYKLIEEYTGCNQGKLNSDLVFPKVDQKRGSQVVYNLQLMVDSHLPIFECMLRHGFFKDSRLTNVDDNEDDLSQSIVEQYDPKPENVPFAGNIPDISATVSLGNVWYDMKLPSKKNIVTALIHIFACKTQNHKCQLRNFFKILSKYMNTYPSIKWLFQMLLEVSLLGNYPHAKKRPPFGKRLWIYTSFRIGNLSNEQLFSWMDQNSRLVHFATKELYMYFVEKHMVLDSILGEDPNWDKIKNCVFEAMDMTRTMISCDGDNFGAIEKELKRLRTQGSLITKLKKEDFLKRILKDMDKFYKKNVLDKTSTEIQNSLIDLSTFSDEREFYIQIDLIEKLTKSDLTKNESGKIKFKWLKCFGITEGSYETLRKFFLNYQMNELPNNSTLKLISAIYENSRRDFHLTRVYFTMLERERDTKEYPLSTGYFENTIKSLRLKFGILPWEEFPEYLGIFYYCTVCQQWAHPLSHPIRKTSISQMSKKEKSLFCNIYAKGGDGMFYDYETKEKYCGRQDASIEIKKLIETGVYYNTEDLTEQTARLIRKHKELERCRNTPLKGVWMPGKCKRLGGQLWALCEICGCLAKWEGAKFDSFGFSCQNHSIFKKQPSENTKPKNVDFEILAEGIVTEGEGSKRINEGPRCYYCGKPPFADTKFNIIEDDVNYGYVKAWFCKTDYEICKTLLSNEAYVKRTELFRTIRRVTKRNMFKFYK